MRLHRAFLGLALLLIASNSACRTAAGNPPMAPADSPVGPVSDPDGRSPANRQLPRITLTSGGDLNVTGGDAYWEQAIVVWRAGPDAGIVQVGQVARGSKAVGRPGGDAPHRPTFLRLAAPGDYYFECWHKTPVPGIDITEVPWAPSAERLSGDSVEGYTLRCEDSPAMDDFDDIVAVIKPTP